MLNKLNCDVKSAFTTPDVDLEWGLRDDKQTPGALRHVPVTSPEKAGSLVQLDIATPLKQTPCVLHFRAFGGGVNMATRQVRVFPL